MKKCIYCSTTHEETTKSCANCKNRKKIWYQTHKEEQAQRKKKRYYENPGLPRTRSKEWYAANTGRAKASKRKKAYGLEPSEHERMLSEQNGVCAICERECRTGRDLAVDHNHKTYKVRGLLCNDCNLGLGKFEENVVLLRSAANYLEKYA